MKTCSRCGVSKKLDRFAKRSKSPDGHAVWCKECFKAYDRERYKTIDKGRKNRNAAARRARVKDWIFNYLSSHPCVDCGESDWTVLEFDHFEDKSENISNMIHWNGLEAVKSEVAKCEVRCANCHRRKTARQFGTWRSI